MKKYLLFLVFFISILSYAQTFSIPDSNFEQALIDLNLDNTSPTNEIDGLMNSSVASAVTDLDLSNRDINDLSGIENFINVEWLFLANNNLTEVNLLNNLSITRLMLTGNELTSLDISTLSNLERLLCGQNQLTSLTLPTTNSVLNKLECPINNLTSIDLSNSLLLEDILINNNSLSELDFSDNTLITEIDANDNELTSVNLDNTNLIEDINFRNNLLTELIIEDRPELSYINLEFNSLNTLTVKNVDSSVWDFYITLLNNPNLTCVAVSDPTESTNEWTAVDSQVYFSLDCISSSVINIPDSNFEQALIDLGIDTDGIINGQVLESDITDIQFLNIFSKNISDLTGIESFQSLEGLYAFDNNLSSVDLSANVALTEVVLGFNSLTNIDLSNNINLTSITLSDNQITELDLSNNLMLTQLYLQNNLLTILDVSFLTELSKVYVDQNSLNELDLSQNLLLTEVSCRDNDLISLNLQNSTNTNIGVNDFDARINPDLTCITVDDINYSNSLWSDIDSQSFFGLNCAPSNDDCSSAISITLGQDTAGTTESSTSGVLNPVCQQNGIVVFDVWFQFIAPNSGSVTMTLNVPQNLAIAKVAMYEDCNDENALVCAEGELQVNNLNPNQNYYLQVWLEVPLTTRSSNNSQVGDFTINVQDTSVLSTDHEDLNDSFHLFPNPAKDSVMITSFQPINAYHIYDLSGKLIMSDSGINKLKYAINTSELSNGMYMIQVDGESKTTIKKLLIK